MDIDKNGTLDQMEVRIGLAALGRKCSKGQMQELFGDFDEDDNQVLDFAEFLNLVLQLEQRPETLYRGLVGAQRGRSQAPSNHASPHVQHAIGSVKGCPHAYVEYSAQQCFKQY
eukprot:scaffold7446_cov403-Prasinococcus_capsulatus_cf.AAC.6